MSATTSGSQTSNSVTAQEIDAVERALIDASARLPVLFFYATSFLWLLVATLLGFIASIKLHQPEFLGGWSWLTYGRISPAYLDVFVYGWAIPAGIGTALWVMARICRVEMGRPLVLVVGGLFWNVGVCLGLLEVLAGNSLGFELLEFPRYVAAILFVSYALVAAWVAVMLRTRKPPSDSVPAWYLGAAFFWFPWLLGAAYAALTIVRFHGVAEAVASGWYAQGLLGFWFVSVGLGVAFYLIPKVAGRPVYSAQLASLGFWGFAFIWGLTGATRYSGGPQPVWLSTVGIAASILMLIPVAAVAFNLAKTLEGKFQLLQSNPVIQFAGFGAAAWLAASFLSSVISLRSVDRITHFTQVGAGLTQLLAYGFYTMVIFGSMYYIIPRVLGRDWISPAFIRMHFWGSAYGIGLMVFLLILGGVNQGLAWADPQNYKSAVDVVEAMLPFLRVTSIAWLLLIGGHLVFGLHLLMTLLGIGKQTGGLVHPAPEGKGVEP